MMYDVYAWAWAWAWIEPIPGENKNERFCDDFCAAPPNPNMCVLWDMHTQ